MHRFRSTQRNRRTTVALARRFQTVADSRPARAARVPSTPGTIALVVLGMSRLAKNRHGDRAEPASRVRRRPEHPHMRWRD